MKEARGNLWEYPADMRIITTNGDVNSQGEAVMGRGCALEAKERIPGLAKFLGELIRRHGNRSYDLSRAAHDYSSPVSPFVNPIVVPIITFPVKYHWHEKANRQLIRVSAQSLAIKANWGWPAQRPGSYVLPRPGCGNGGLRWEDVKPILDPILDDRFTCITF